MKWRKNINFPKLRDVRDLVKNGRKEIEKYLNNFLYLLYDEYFFEYYEYFAKICSQKSYVKCKLYIVNGSVMKIKCGEEENLKYLQILQTFILCNS